MATDNRRTRYIYRVWIAEFCALVCLKSANVYALCGGYTRTSSNSVGVIQSPNYPQNYGNDVNCIWLIEAPAGCAINLTINNIQLDKQTTSFACGDYVQVRKGSSVETVLYDSCNSTTSTAQARWLWVRFHTDFAGTSTGFTASWKTIPDSSTSSLSEPFLKCDLEFHCLNKECVPLSYRCDNYNDCGCEEDKCDEVGCGGLDISNRVRIAIGISVGVFTFLLLFLGLGFLDICLKKRAERKYKQQLEKNKQIQRQRKARAMARLFVSQCSTDGSRTSTDASGMLGVPVRSTGNGSITSITK